MGYDLRITRALDWTANQGAEISSAEWMAHVAGDPDLAADPPNGPFAVRFGDERWFDWYEGNIFTTDPDHATVTKMVGLAESFAATIQGDDGEFYDSANQWSRRAAARRRREAGPPDLSAR